MAEQLCISSVTLGELRYGAEKSARRLDNRQAIEHLMIGGHARSEGLVLVTNNPREFEPMPGLRVESWL